VVPKRQRSASTTIRNGTRGGTRTPLRVAAVVYDDTAAPGSGLSGERSHRTPAAVSAGSALVRVGYTAVAGSMLVSLGDAGLVGFPLFSLLAAVLFAGYVVVYWSAIFTRRVEAGALGMVSLGLGVLYLWANAWQ